MIRVLPPVGKALFIGMALTVVGAIYSMVFPNATNYLFLPGMMVVYVLAGGVHGDSTGVHLPSLLVWYVIGGIVNVAIYFLLAFVLLKRFGRHK